MSEPRPVRRFAVPPRLFGGRVRTTTLALCTLWLGMWLLYLFLNQPENQGAEAPATAVIISETPYVPYVPPAASYEPDVPATDAPSTEDAVPSDADTPTTPETTVQTTPFGTPTPTPTQEPSPNRQFPFEVPRVPGIFPQQVPPESEITGETEP